MEALAVSLSLQYSAKVPYHLDHFLYVSRNMVFYGQEDWYD